MHGLVSNGVAPFSVVVVWGASPHLLEHGLALLACTEHEPGLVLLRAHPSTHCDTPQTIAAACAVFLLGLCLPLILGLCWRCAWKQGRLEPTRSGSNTGRLELRRDALRSALRKLLRVRVDIIGHARIR